MSRSCFQRWPWLYSGFNFAFALTLLLYSRLLDVSIALHGLVTALGCLVFCLGFVHTSISPSVLFVVLFQVGQVVWLHLIVHGGWYLKFITDPGVGNGLSEEQNLMCIQPIFFQPSVTERE